VRTGLVLFLNGQFYEQAEGVAVFPPVPYGGL
jgi:hypothetical protein